MIHTELGNPSYRVSVSLTGGKRLPRIRRSHGFDMPTSPRELQS